MTTSFDKIRNVAIVAHVDHGKTTMVDGLLKQSNTFRHNQAEMAQHLIMDSGDQESERGITITAKLTAVDYHDYKINIIDTPGHADFSSEIERTLNMADGVLLIVDAQEGVMPQTKFVLSKALQMGLRPVVVINKIDKPGRDIARVEDGLSDLFLELATDEAQLQYPIYYAIGREGKAWAEMPADSSAEADLTPLFEAILHHIPAPKVAGDGEFQMQVSALDYDNFLGKYAIGRIHRGQIKVNDQVVLIASDGSTKKVKIDKVFEFKGLNKVEVSEARAGQIVALVGAGDAKIGNTLASVNQPEAMPDLEIEPPTLKIYLGPNTSPFKGQESKFSTSRQIGDRLRQELETNVGLRVEPNEIGFTVSGRGELHLSVLIEAMRREGYEFEVGRPEVITIEEDGVTKEPVEDLFIEVDNEFLGAVSQTLGKRYAQLRAQTNLNDNVVRLEYEITSRALIGLRSESLTLTRGTVVMNSLPKGYQPLSGKIMSDRNGVLIAFETGVTTAYALQAAEARGELMVGPGVNVYQGQIVGIYNRQEDLEINVCKMKHLTNMRSKSSDGTIQLTPHRVFSLEQCLDFLADDELLEVTPANLRLRKKYLDPNVRKRHKN